ncbi:uncharacterized protein LOC107640442 [Arachis ipaensis]|uniref:uncharacterized protein LOC107640442 n=1 Tax=Arachis ipaensis TaxID=130454 RepID=UPI0007AFD7E1|nr:uncharacterized protein LOC107640442 [Arachis ipaensis]
MKLTTSMRLTVGANHTQLRQISQFAEWLLTVGDGLAGNFVYPNLLLNLNNGSYFKNRTTLAPTLEIVNNVNKHIMKSLIGEEKTYLSSDSLCVEEDNMESELDTITPDVLNAINCSCLPPYLLTFKEVYQ